jgi:SOS-response transcriptional repressor LexA
MTTIHGLREGAARLLDHIHAQVATHGIPPSFDEMATALDRSRATIDGHLAILEARGWITRPAGRPNIGITLTSRTWPPTAASTNSTVQDLTGSLRT